MDAATTTDPIRNPEEHRTFLELVIKGSAFPAGEIPLHRLAEISERTQTVVRRLARALTQRGAAGRTPKWIEDATELRLVGIREGSTVLEIAGPQLQAEMDLGDVDEDVGVQALRALEAGFSSVAEQRALPSTFDEPSTEALADWFGAFADAESVGIRGRTRGVAFESIIVPQAARAFLVPRSAPPESRGQVVSVEGVLYEVNLDAGSFRLKDDTGHSIYVSMSISAEEARPLLERRVQVTGAATTDASGRLTIDATELVASQGLPGLDRDAFYRVTALNDLVGSVAPLATVRDLAIDGVTDDEAADFLAALERPA